MKYLKPAILVTVVSLTTACTTVKNWLSDTPNVNNTKQSTTTLVVPEDLLAPNKSNEFKLAPNSKTANASEVVTSPSSVLEIFQGSWVNSDDSHPYKIMLEKPQQVDNFDSFLSKTVADLIESRGYKLISSNDGYRIEVVKESEIGFWFWKNSIDTERFVFDLHTKVQSHGRSGEAYIEPIEFQVLSKNNAPKFSKAYRMQQLSIEMLNQLSLELNYQFRVVVQKQQILTDVSLAMTTNSSGDFVISSQREIQHVYKQLEDIIEDLGFSIEEEDKGLFLYTLSYDKNNSSIWNSIFGSDYANKLSLPSGQYEVVLITSIDGVYASFSDEAGQPLSESQVKEIFDLIIKIVKEDEIEL
ncbi:outer membrane protein assembly factor BamC [Psychrosphaera aestuarii]|uniref:outer membrane protein assembly factor BamC n=1 Tax=Psychrosphaera aestuarii TaxID=1266052 RepID=UPI001B320481|nr:outer membrane protein assembly factor BamC [Psychrosphaera aestuarii]